MGEDATVDLPGLERSRLATGVRFLRLHYYADPEKDERWLAQVEQEMSDTPNDFKREILMAELTGHPYFDNDKLAEYYKSCPKPVWTLGLPNHTADVHVVLRKFLEREVWPVKGQFGPTIGRIDFWDKVRPNCLYMISADPALGLTKKGDPDSCAAKVFETMSWTEVACAEGKWNTHEFGMILNWLGRYFNMALIGVERNTHGEAVLNTLEFEAMYPQAVGEHMGPGIYYHTEWDDRITKQEPTRKPGWPTTTKTKTLALDMLAYGLISGQITIRDAKTIAQMMRFVHLPDGKYGGEAGSHDDNVLAAAIGAALLNMRPIKTTFVAEQMPISPSAINVMAEFAKRNDDMPAGFDPWASILANRAEEDEYQENF